MKSIEIKGSVRTDLGKKATRELRKNNGVPCVVYGVQKDENGNPVATHFSVTTDGLRNLGIHTAHLRCRFEHRWQNSKRYHERYPVPPC